MAKLSPSSSYPLYSSKPETTSDTTDSITAAPVTVSESSSADVDTIVDQTKHAQSNDDPIPAENKSAVPDEGLADTLPTESATHNLVKTSTLLTTSNEKAAATRKDISLRLLDEHTTTNNEVFNLLASKNYNIIHIASPQDAFAFLLENQTDALVVNLPASTSNITEYMGLINDIRCYNALQTITTPLIFIAENLSSQTQQSLRDAGIDELINKPVDSSLYEKINSLVEQNSVIPIFDSPEYTLNVCLLEDSFNLAHTVVDFFAHRTHNVDHFSTCDKTREAIILKNYDLILLGQNEATSILTYIDLIKTIRLSKDSQKQSVPVFILTTNTSTENLSILKRVGVSSIIVIDSTTELQEQLLKTLAFDKIEETYEKNATPFIPYKYGAYTHSLEKHSRSEQHHLARKDFHYRANIDVTEFDSIEDQVAFSENGFANVRKWISRNFLNTVLIITTTFAIVTLSTFIITDYIGSAFAETPKKSISVLTVPDAIPAISKNFSGRISSLKQINLTTQTAGYITDIYVEEGDKVTKGAVLARLDVRKAEEKIKLAQARLATINEEITFKKRAQEEIENAMQRGDGAANLISVTKADLEVALSKKRVVAAELHAAKLDYDQLHVHAPFAGTIKQSYAIEGLWAEPPGAIFKLVDLSHQAIYLKVNAENATNLFVGRLVTVTSTAFPGVEWQEEITQITPAKNNAGIANNDDYLIVHISLGVDAPPLLYGQEVSVQAKNEARSAVVKLPAEAVKFRDGKEMVAIVNNNAARYIPVELGQQSLSHIEVIKGLVPGQQVILTANHLEDGQHIGPVKK